MTDHEQKAKDYSELMKNMRDYCNNKTESILALIEFETNQDLSIYTNDVKISQFVMAEVHTTDWTNE